MKATWVLLLAVGVVSADVGLGYHYKVPQTSYGVPSYQFGSSNSGQYSSAYAGSQGGYQGHQTSGYQTGSSHSGSGSGYNYQSSGSNSGVNYVKPNYQTGYNTQYDSSSQYQTSAVNKYQQYYQVQQQPAQIFKHFYVHAAPEEREEVKVRKPIVLPPPQKHYKIIFVKAPSEASAPQVIAPVQPQNEEKTIVYVLVKKPDEQPEVVLPKIEQKPPSKPEVYFIKYKNKEDSQAVINNIVKDYNQGHSVSLNSGSAEGSYQSPVAQYPHHSTSGGSFSSLGSNSQAFGLSTASSSSGSGLEESNISSSISSPVTVSSTASSAGYEGAISTSQGVPHETYGPPKFRVN